MRIRKDKLPDKSTYTALYEEQPSTEIKFENLVIYRMVLLLSFVFTN